MSALQIYISPAKICVMQALRMDYATTLALQSKHNSSQKLWDKIEGVCLVVYYKNNEIPQMSHD